MRRRPYPDHTAEILAWSPDSRISGALLAMGAQQQSVTADVPEDTIERMTVIVELVDDGSETTHLFPALRVSADPKPTQGKSTDAPSGR